MMDMNDDPRTLVAELISRELGRSTSHIRLLGRGADHLAFDVDGDLVARVATGASDTGPSQVEREFRLLVLVATVAPIPVPTVAAVDASNGVMVTTKLAGVSLLDRPSRQPERLSPQLAELLASLRGLPVGELRTIVDEEDYAPGVWLDDATSSYSRIAHALDERQRRLVEGFLDSPAPAPATERVLCHNDLGAEHLLARADGTALTGVIDWTDASLTDPTIDLARLYRDLGPPIATDIAARLGLDLAATLPRAAFYGRCALLEDLAYGVTTGDRRYSDAAVANLARTFAQGAS